MSSIRHNPFGEPAPDPSPEDAYLDAARDNILAVGWRRTTLTDVAKRAGVSRMTIYRRWPDMQSLLADLLVREWGTLLDTTLVDPATTGRGTAAGPAASPAASTAARAVAAAVVTAVGRLRENPLFCKIVDVDPELLLPYLLHRSGRNQDQVIELLTAAVTAGQQDGSIRAGSPRLMADALLLTLQGFVLSAATLTDDETSLEDLDAELALLIERFLAR